MAGPEEKNAIPGDTTTPPTPTSVADKKENTPIDNVVSRTPVPPSRFRLWYALTVFAAVSLIALSTETETSEWRVEEQWVLSVTLMSLILGSFASLANIRFQAIFVGMPLEGLLLFTQLGFWVGGLIVMMDPNNTMAVDANGRVLNPNLFFFSWASLVATITLLVGFVQQVDGPIMALIPNCGYWIGVGLSSLVVMASSVQIFVNGVTLNGQEFDCQDGDLDIGSGFCKRLKFSIALSVISLCVSGACCLLSFKISPTINVPASLSMLFAWTLGVALVTFGDNSPGNDVCNLYFGCWAAFVLCLFMVSTNIKNVLSAREEVTPTQENNDDKEVTPNDSSSATEKAEEPLNKPAAEAEVAKRNSNAMTPPKSISIVKDSHEVPDDEVEDAVDATKVDVEEPASAV